MPIVGPDILKYETSDRIVIITLNRPERLNAISLEMATQLEKAWTRFRDDDSAWVCILTGSGSKAFCSGWDLVDQAGRDKKAERVWKPPRYWPFEIWKPIICAINGYAIAGGFQLAHACDVRIAADNSEFGISETMWNLPAWWLHDISPQLQLAHALELALWGDARITARRAYEIGWVNRVVPAEKLMEEAQSWAERMLHLGPRSVRNLKEIIYRGSYMSPHDAMRFAETLETNLEGMEDTREGPRAFAEKRKPQFRNR